MVQGLGFRVSGLGAQGSDDTILMHGACNLLQPPRPKAISPAKPLRT